MVGRKAVAAVPLGTVGGLTEAEAAYLEGTEDRVQAGAAEGVVASHMSDQDTGPNMPEERGEGEEEEEEGLEHNSPGAAVDMTLGREPGRILDAHTAAVVVVADQPNIVHTEQVVVEGQHTRLRTAEAACMLAEGIPEGVVEGRQGMLADTSGGQDQGEEDIL